ncbi:hypothetical protein E3N88_44136 [Mikania micrantha]|uniref:UBA domain-containing protein n=1 Tax=Mikania micrantha TaxID=192012 RepID=A0A5N6LDG9_9ASTR|nr:hypothetical protein E3N88_44136 [Mikania micrantha]
MASQNPKFSKSFLFISWKASLPSVSADRFHERITGVAIGSEESTKLSPNKVSQIASLGFNPLQCQKESINISNFKLEEVMNWLLSHMDDLGHNVFHNKIVFIHEGTVKYLSPRLVLSTIAFAHELADIFGGDWRSQEDDSQQAPAREMKGIRIPYALTFPIFDPSIAVA